MAFLIRRQNKNKISIWNKRYFSYFENYSKTSKDYDKTRTIPGINEIGSTLFTLYENKYEPMSAYYTDKNYCENKTYDQFLKELRVLDAGCGTGNYLMHLRHLGIGSITGLELNEGMLNQCTTKLELQCNENNCLVQLYNNCIIDMPFKPLSFDVIMVNMVFHHIDNAEKRLNNYQNIRKALSNCYNKLNYNGVLCITTSYPSQLKQYWYNQFFPSCLQLIDEKYNEFNWWENNLISSGFKNINETIITETSMTKDSYYNFNGIFDEQWRNGDSTFSVLSVDELKKGQHKIHKIINDAAETKLFIDKYENLRETLGHSVAIVAYK